MSNHKGPALVVFQGGAVTSSPFEKLVAGAQAVATLDLLAAASVSGTFSRAVLVTEQESLASAVSGLGELPVTVVQLPASDNAGAIPFHFGEHLLSICKALSLERVVYVGGGAMPLATSQM